MELVAILSVLWARRLVVALGAVVAIAAATFAIRGISPGATTAPWVASARVLIDTADSQLVNVAPKGVGTLPTRALLIADFMASDPLKSLVANDAGVPANRLDVLVPSSRAPEVLTPLVTKAAKFATAAPDPYVLSLYADGQSSIIAIEATAPDATRASTLAGAAIGVLKSSVSSQQAGGAQGLTVTALAPPRAAPVVGHSSRRVLAVIGSLVAFVLWCAAIVLVSGIVARARPAQPA
jgi:uncharacterized protein involved in exopolysaccharide biosynthesis